MGDIKKEKADELDESAEVRDKNAEAVRRAADNGGNKWEIRSVEDQATRRNLK
jgi:hypothetical protein